MNTARGLGKGATTYGGTVPVAGLTCANTARRPMFPLGSGRPGERSG